MSPDKGTLDQLKISRPVQAAPRRRRGPLVTIGILVAVAITAIWWWKRPSAIPVRTAVVQSVSVEASRTLLNASGYVTARRQATVSSKVTGRVVEVLVEEGMDVAEGQKLASIDASNTEASLRLAEAQIASARSALGETEANLTQAEKFLERTRKLAAEKVVSDVDLDRATADAAGLRARMLRQKADIEVAERQLAIWRQQLDDTIIRAPFAGVVVSKNAQPGEMISPLSAGGAGTRTGICTLVDMNSREVEVDVNESYINRVEAGQPVVVTLDSYPDWKIAAKVIAIVPTADRQKATVRVRVGFDELDPRILPDMGLKVAFQSGEEPAAAQRVVAVPRSAVRRVAGKDIVWVVRDDQAERRAVSVRDTRGDEVTLSAGLQPGERIVVEGPDSLSDGARVTERKS